MLTSLRLTSHRFLPLLILLAALAWLAPAVPAFGQEVLTDPPPSPESAVRENGATTPSPPFGMLRPVSDPITSFPYTQNFDGVTPPALPEGWTVANGASNDVAWKTATNWSHSSPNHIELIFDDDQAQDDWFITPPLQLKAGKLYRVEFYYTADWIKDANSPASMEVRWAAQPTVAAMAGGQQIWNSPAFNWFEYRLGAGTVLPDQDGIYYVAWHGYSPKFQAGIDVDDITITEIDPTVSVFPYSENFDGVTAPALPQGWRVANGAANNVAWTNTDSTLAPSQPNAMKIALDSANAQDDWVMSLPLALKAGAHYQVEFYYYISGANTDKLEVKWAAAPTVAAMSAGQRIWSNAGLTGEDTGTTAQFSPATDGIYYIGWHSSSPAGQVFIYVDNITITETPLLAVDLVTLGARPAAPVTNPWIAVVAGALLAAALGRMVVSQRRCR